MLIQFWNRKYQILQDHFQSGFGPRALLCSVNRPFLKGVNLKHNNQTEALEMAQVFHELGYQVDVVNYDNPMAIDYARYEVVFGSGAAFQNLFLKETTRLPRTILYHCGAYIPLSNAASLRRLEAVYRRRGVWLPGSARLTNAGIGTEQVVDGLIVLGNEVAAAPFRALPPRPVHEIPLFFHQMVDADDIIRARDLSQARRHFIWFSGSGLVHKGLDLALEAFARHPELHLHVFGDLEGEAPFVRTFQHELQELPNVHVEGFLHLQSPAFRAALVDSAFTICASCAEACTSAVLNICGNGGNIPLLTRNCAIDLRDFGVLIGDTTIEAVEAALVEASSLSEAELDRRQRSSAAFFREAHSLERYHQRMKGAIQAVLDGEAPREGSGIHPGRQPLV